MSVPGSSQPAPLPMSRLRAVRAIMDGRGVQAAVVSDPVTLAWFGASGGAILLVLAGEAVLVPQGAAGWDEVARRVGRSRVGADAESRTWLRGDVVPLDRDLARLRSGRVTA